MKNKKAFIKDKKTAVNVLFTFRCPECEDRIQLNIVEILEIGTPSCSPCMEIEDLEVEMELDEECEIL